MGATFFPFLCGSIALLAGLSLWRAHPRGSSGAVLQWGLLAGLNGWALWLAASFPPGAPMLALGAGLGVVVLLLVPAFLRHLAETQLRIGRPGPMHWLLFLRFLVCWDRRNLLDVLYLPVRLLLARGRADEAVTVARAVQGTAWLRGLEPEQAGVLAAALGAAKRFAEVCADDGIRRAAGVHPPTALALARAQAETGDLAGAQATLRAVDERRAGVWAIHLGWAHLLSVAGDAPGLARWVELTGLRDDPRLAAVVASLEARLGSRGNAPVSPVRVEPPVTRVLDDRATQAADATLRRPGPVTLGTMAAIGLGQVALWAAGGADDPAALVRCGALIPTFVEEGQAWRLVTTAFVHAGALHLVANLLGLAVIGRMAEGIFGSGIVLAMLVWGTIAGGIGTCLGGAGVSVGVSGGLMALAGAVLARVIRPVDGLPERVREPMWRGLVLAVVLTAAYGAVEARVDNGGHLGGLLGGFLLGRLFPTAGVARVSLGSGRALVAAAGVAFGLVSVAHGGLALFTGGLPSPVRRVIVNGPTGPLEVPAWWKVLRNSDPGVHLLDPVLRLDLTVAPDDGRTTLGAHVLAMITESKEPTRASPVVSAPQRLASGVEWVVARVAFVEGDAEVWALRAARGGRAALVIASAPGRVLPLYEAIVLDLAAQATPP